MCSIRLPAMRLDKATVAELRCPPGKRDVLVFDDALPGFGLRVTDKGAKTFILQYQIGGRRGARRRMVLGRADEVTAIQARRMAEIARAKIRLGFDPEGERRAAVTAALAAAGAERAADLAAAYTLSNLIEEWATLGLADRSPAHRAEAPRALNAALARELTAPAAALDRMRVQAIVDGLAEKRIASAHRLKAYGHAAFQWGQRRGKVEANPFAGVKVEGREQSRDRVLSERELGEAWRAAAGLPYPFGPFVRMLMLTLQRRAEVAGLRWSELSPDRTIWTLPAPRAKNRQGHLVHLAPEARAILATVPQLGADALVFTSDARPRVPRGTRKQAVLVARPASEARAVSGFSDAMEQLKAAIEAERKKAGSGDAAAAGPPINWRFHNFRRTGVTTLARLGFPPHVADKILNHFTGAIRGVAAVYQRHAFEAERKAALEAWSAYVLKCAAVAP